MKTVTKLKGIKRRLERDFGYTQQSTELQGQIRRQERRAATTRRKVTSR